MSGELSTLVVHENSPPKSEGLLLGRLKEPSNGRLHIHPQGLEKGLAILDDSTEILLLLPMLCMVIDLWSKTVRSGGALAAIYTLSGMVGGLFIFLKLIIVKKQEELKHQDVEIIDLLGRADMSLGVQANHAFSAGDVWKILSSSHPDGFSRLLKKIHDPEFLAMLNTDSPFPGLTLFECEYYQHRLRIIADTAYLAVCIPAACLMPSFAMKSTCAITAGILALAAFRSMRDMKQMSDALAVQEIDVPLPFPLNHIMTADAKMTAKINTVFKKAGERFDKVMEKIMPHERGAR